MGTDFAPVVANLFLFAYEYGLMKGLLKYNITLAIKFSNTYRYIDDLLCIKNKDFEKVHLSTLGASRDTVFSTLLSSKRFDPGGLLQ